MDEKERKAYGEDIAFGIQQTLACWATDFIDPYVGKVVQDRFADDRHKGTLKHTWGGEIIGDSTALFTFLGVQRFAPWITRGLSRLARSALNPLFERTGRRELKRWAESEHVREDSDAYRARLEEWKDFQAGNVAKSTVISVSSIAANVATQKAMGNTHRMGVILISKVIGAAITMGAMLGLRFLIPKSARQLDDELSERYFSPLIHKTQRLFGAETDEAPKARHDKPGNHARKLERRRETGAAQQR